MTTSISIHVDGYYGLVKGVPNLLDLFYKHNVRATFFVNLGREANIFELLRYQNKNNLNSEDKKVIFRYSKRQLIEMALLNRKLGHGHPELLREIKRRGHEINPHCWSHLRWSKNFKGINHEKEIKKMKESYRKILGSSPGGFAPPTWKYNKKIIKILKKEGFSYLSTNGPADTVFFEDGLKVIPLSFEKNIEELLNEGRSEKEVIKIFKKESKKDYVNWYFHADYEGLAGIKSFEKVLKLIKNKKIKLYKEL